MNSLYWKPKEYLPREHSSSPWTRITWYSLEVRFVCVENLWPYCDHAWPKHTHVDTKRQNYTKELNCYASSGYAINCWCWTSCENGSRRIPPPPIKTVRANGWSGTNRLHELTPIVMRVCFCLKWRRSEPALCYRTQLSCLIRIRKLWIIMWASHHLSQTRMEMAIIWWVYSLDAPSPN